MTRGIDRLYDERAEERVLGAVIGLPVARTEDARRSLVAEDFYLSSHRTVWAATLEAVAEGLKGLPTIVAKTADALGGPELTYALLGSLAEHGGYLNDAEVAAAVARVADRAAARRAWQAAEDLRVALERGEDPEDAAAKARDVLGDVRSVDSLPAGLAVSSELYEQEPEEREVVVPGLFNRDTRVVVVGYEGSGKTVLMRQVAELPAQGFHPFRHQTFAPIRTLTVDLENPKGAVRHHLGFVKPLLARQRNYDPERAWLWHAPEGIDIRSARGYGQFTAVLRKTRPDLVCIGPAYHMARKAPREDHEDFATSVLNVMSDLRARFGFALMIEHHAPHGDTAHRDLRPFGSSAWLRWPELGIALQPDGPEVDPFSMMKLDRWRGDREPNSWPTRLGRATSGMRPWFDLDAPGPDDGRRRR
jgi:hypothetical protein